MKLFDDKLFIAHLTSQSISIEIIEEALDEWAAGQVGRTPEEMMEIGLNVEDQWFVNVEDTSGNCYLEIHFVDNEEKGMIGFSCKTGADMFVNSMIATIATHWGLTIDECDIIQDEAGYTMVMPEHIKFKMFTDFDFQ